MENLHSTQTPIVQENSVTQSNKKPSLLMLMSGVVLMTAFIAGGIGYYLGSMKQTQTVSPEQEVQVSTKPESNQVACTMEAKLCPDGSSVGRSGPNCEFEECPAEVTTVDQTSLVNFPSEEKDFCMIQEQQTIKFLSEPNPADFIARSQYKNELTNWKKAFISRYGWSEDYFNQHIRIHQIDQFSKDGIEFINPQYTYSVGWASFGINADVVKIGTGEVVEFTTQNIPLSEEILPCKELVGKLTDLDSSLNPESLGFRTGIFFISSYGGGYSGKLNGCSTASINLENAEIFNSRLDGPCRID